MIYTINNKPYTLFDINKRCAELLDLKFQVYGYGTVHKGIFDLKADKYFDPCKNCNYTWPIIEKVWGELNELQANGVTPVITKWQQLIEKHNCTKLVAACICCIEMNEVE